MSLSVADGEVVALIGPSGCGKSTLLNIGSGLYAPTAGEAFVDGEKVQGPNRHVAFAYGIHFCLGAPLARLEAQLTFDTLLRRFPNLTLQSTEARWKPMIFLRGLESLPVRWRAGG